VGELVGQERRPVLLGGEVQLALFARQALNLGRHQPLAQSPVLGDQLRVRRGGRRLPLQGPHRAPKLAQDISEAHEVVVDAFDLAQRALLASAELSNLGRLFDERPSVLGSCLQHPIELPLADERVEAPPDARVRQQLGDIEQPARGPVDPVLRGPRPVRRAADGHLGDGERQDPG
jgi:hypothetical protein